MTSSLSIEIGRTRVEDLLREAERSRSGAAAQASAARRRPATVRFSVPRLPVLRPARESA